MRHERLARLGISEGIEDRHCITVQLNDDLKGLLTLENLRYRRRIIPHGFI